MPIKVEDAKKYEGYEEDEVKIARFLNEHAENAYTQDEITKGIGMTPTVYTKDEKGSYWTWENAGKFALHVANRILFKDTLEKMVKTGKIKASESGGKRYYFIEGNVLF
jgi:hypothetical protein